MLPVAIFRHARTEEPGYFGEFLDQHSIPWRLIKMDQGEPVPTSWAGFSGLAFMGGPMSVNDDLPWIAPVLSLIREALSNHIPTLGHCLGGQLMAKALGGVVRRNPTKEIGWGTINIGRHPYAKEWFGDLQSFVSFHWHGETFSIPPGATRLASSPYCDNQVFVIGNSLAMQCHVEMTGTLVHSWCETGASEIAQSPGPGVQDPQRMRENLERRLEALNRVADRIYARWLSGLKRT
jgi:GMP synthase-like glutamine amidotransferase